MERREPLIKHCKCAIHVRGHHTCTVTYVWRAETQLIKSLSKFNSMHCTRTLVYRALITLFSFRLCVTIWSYLYLSNFYLTLHAHELKLIVLQSSQQTIGVWLFQSIARIFAKLGQWASYHEKTIVGNQRWTFLKRLCARWRCGRRQSDLSTLKNLRNPGKWRTGCHTFAFPFTLSQRLRWGHILFIWFITLLYKSSGSRRLAAAIVCVHCVDVCFPIQFYVLWGSAVWQPQWRTE